MRILIVHPGASWATADLWRGVFGALERAGVEVSQFALDSRIQVQNDWFRWMAKKHKRAGHPLSYTEADILYGASEGMVTKALRFRPDWILLIAGTYVHPEAIYMCKRAGFRIAAILTESPYDDVQETRLAGVADALWTNERASVPIFAQHCKSVHYPTATVWRRMQTCPSRRMMWCLCALPLSSGSG